jgi:acyl-CoA reductase-like NAD-dependent aldehyde dehydrogenase
LKRLKAKKSISAKNRHKFLPGISTYRLARALRAGTVWINCHIDVTAPCGGYKQSGFGRELGLHSLELYTQLKSVWLRMEECA